MLNEASCLQQRSRDVGVDDDGEGFCVDDLERTGRDYRERCDILRFGIAALGRELGALSEDSSTLSNVAPWTLIPPSPASHQSLERAHNV